MFGNAFGGKNAPKLAPLGPVYVTVKCNLQEFYNGCIKHITYQRQQVALDGQNMTIQTVEKKINVKRGMANKNMLIFKEEGNVLRNGPPTELIVQFELDQSPCSKNENASLLPRYTRKGNDLIYTHSLSLQEAMSGEPVRIETLDGRTLIQNIDEFISP